MGLMKKDIYIVSKISMYAAKNVNPKSDNFKEIVSVKKAYNSKDKAQAEVERLNELNAGGATESYYFWQKAVLSEDTA